MSISQEERDNAAIFLPAGEDFNQYKTDDEIEWDKFRDEMQDGIDYAKLTIWKVPVNERGQATQKQMGFCFECGMQDFSFSQLCSKIQSEFGGGIFRLQARDAQGKMIKNKGINIVPPKDAPNGSAGNTADIIDRVQNAINQGQEQTRRMLVTAHNPQANVDPLDQMTKMMTAMGTMMGAMGIKPSEPVAPVAPQSLTSQIKEFLMLKELMGNLSGDSSGGDANLYSLLTETMKSFGGPIASAIAAGQTTGEVSPQGLLQNPATENKPVLTAEENEQQKYGEAMKTQVRILIANAKNKADPQQFATLVVANTPDEKLDALYEFISAPDFYDRILAMNPEVEIYKDWFIKLRDAVMELLTEPENENTIPEVASHETVAGESIQMDAPISEQPESDVTANS